MTETTDRSARFLELHRKGAPLLLANAWDRGSARLLASLGFEALATTSAGHAGTLGRRDGRVTRDEALAHSHELAAATPLPVNADLENCFADAPEDVAETIRLAAETGLAGASIEDYARHPEDAIYPAPVAAARVEAAAEAARSAGLILTARCENHIRGVTDLKDTIARLQAYEAAGAHVLYAPGLTDLDQIRQVVEAVAAPVNVLCMPGGPNVADLAAAGVARISVGSAFYNVTMNALAIAAREWRDEGTHEFWQAAVGGMAATTQAFEDS
jgi:2-methylisocitrate lyase-like PEP mutase family enzyme